MLPRKLLPFTTLFLALLGLFLLAQTLPAHSQGNPAADLGLHKAVAPLTALAPGDEIQYTLTFSNAGVLTATDVLISDTLPTLLTGVAIASNFPITSTGQASWIVAPLPPGAGGIITVTATVSPLLTSELPFTNTATITSPITDTEPANNTSFVVSEVNLPPVVDAGPDASAIVGQPFALTATFTDPGLDDTHTAEIAWGDGLTGTAILSETAHTLSATHVYTTTGAFTVAVGVRDNDGGQGADVLVITGEPSVYYQYIPVLSNFMGNLMNYVMVSTMPNKIINPKQVSLSATYAGDIVSTTVTAQTVILHSAQRGVLTGTLDVTQKTLSLSAYKSFQPGEVLQATLTTGILGQVGINQLAPDASTVWTFSVQGNWGSGYFEPGNMPEFGSGNSTDLALGDLDGDWDWDIVVANLDTPATVWLNDGNAHFSPHLNTPELGSGGYRAIELGDLDNDGDLDAVFATFSEEQVWLNNGLGDFVPHSSVPVFGSGDSLDVELGDLNGDGYLDAVIANAGNEEETVWLNDGTGGFYPHPVLASFGGGDSTKVVLGNLDEDFDLDVIVANTNDEPETVWLNDGTGVLSAHPLTPSFGGENSQAIQLGDLDNDGDADVVVANDNAEPETLWLNDGKGVFTPHPTNPAFGTGNSTALALGDLDGDGDLDVIVANAWGEDETVWLNVGIGALNSDPESLTFDSGDTQDIELGDLDGDGDLEAVVANADAETVWTSKEMKVTATVPAGNDGVIAQAGTILVTFDHAVNASTINTDTFSVRGEFSGIYPGTFSFPTPHQVLFTPAIPYLSGEPVMITLNRFVFSEEGYPLKPFTWSVRAAVSGGTGILTSTASFGLGFGRDIAFGDLDGDRDLDMVIALYNPIFGGMGASIWLNEGDGNYIPHPTTPILRGDINTGVVIGDLDDDGDLDALFAGMHSGVVYLNDGTGGLVSYFTFPMIVDDIYETRGYVDMQLADLDGDGDLDAVGSNRSPYGDMAEPPQGEVWLNDGTGQFYPHPSAFSFGIGEVSDALALFDMDQDGDLDVVSSGFNGVAILWLNQGAGHYTRAPIQPDFGALNFEDSTLTYGDLDGDQDVDILAASISYENANTPAAVWLNDGAGHFALHPMTPRFGGSETDCVALSDLDGDGDLDAIFVNYDQPSTVWVNDGLGNYTPHPTMPSFGPQYGFSAASGDIDGDGDIDIMLTGAAAITFPQPEPANWVYQNE